MEDDIYESLLLETLQSIVEQLEQADRNGLIDIDYNDEMIEFSTQDGKYVINKHSATKEIWMVSPISGPQYFHLEDCEWINGNSDSLDKVLNIELKKYGIAIEGLRVEF